MGQEYFINSQELQTKIDQLLPSQGGAGAGVDLSASTQIVPIIDLTESAEGSNVRQDLQTALSFADVTSFDVEATTTTLINTTGYFRVFGNATVENRSTTTSDNFAIFALTDGVSTKTIYELRISDDTDAAYVSNNFDFVVFLSPGDSLTGQTFNTSAHLIGCTKQIADVNGNLTTPT